ncbi:MAG: hypothetical protein QM681_18295 [Novosphingobium sp.]
MTPTPDSTERQQGGEVVLHLHNTRAQRHARTSGAGATWCGKKLLGHPQSSEKGIDTFVSYGAEVRITFDPGAATCEHCRKAFDAAYNAAFPEGLKPIATFRTDSPEDMARAKELLSPEALTKHFGPHGGGMASFEASLRDAAWEGARA